MAKRNLLSDKSSSALCRNRFYIIILEEESYETKDFVISDGTCAGIWASAVSAIAASSTDLDADVPELARLGDTYIQRRTPQQK